MTRYHNFDNRKVIILQAIFILGQLQEPETFNVFNYRKLRLIRIFAECG